MNEKPQITYPAGVGVRDSQEVNWSAVAGAGISFAYVQVTKPASPSDAFATNWSGIRDSGIARGVSCCFQPSLDPEMQARAILDLLGEPESGDLPPALRLEPLRTITGLDQWDGVAQERRAALIITCLQVIEQAIGRKPIIFATSTMLHRVRSSPELAGYGLWLADYRGSHPGVPHPWTDWTFWRYSETATVEGITGTASLDHFHGDEADLDRLAGIEGDTDDVVQGDDDDTADPGAPDEPAPDDSVVEEQTVDGSSADQRAQTGRDSSRQPRGKTRRPQTKRAG